MQRVARVRHRQLTLVPIAKLLTRKFAQMYSTSQLLTSDLFATAELQRPRTSTVIADCVS